MNKAESDKCIYLMSKLLKMLNIDINNNPSMSYILTAIINRIDRRKYGSK